MQSNKEFIKKLRKVYKGIPIKELASINNKKHDDILADILAIESIDELNKMRLYANTIDTVVKQIQIIGIILAFTFTFFGIMLRPVNDNAPGIFLIIFIISCLLMLILSYYHYII
jgi:hypothetical protein